MEVFFRKKMGKSWLFSRNCPIKTMKIAKKINIQISNFKQAYLSNYSSYIQFMLITPMSYKLLKGMAIGYEYKTDIDTRNVLTDRTTRD